MIRRTCAVGMAALLLVGCLPIELDISPDGQVLIPRAEGFFSLDSATGKVRLLHKPKSGKPAFARFLPDGTKIVTATVTGGNGGFPMAIPVPMPYVAGDGTMNASEPLVPGGGGTTIELIDLPTQAATELFVGSNVTYLTTSPDGKRVALTRMSDQQTVFSEQDKQNLPELRIVDLADAKPRLLRDAGPVASIHRWFPDSKAILVFQIKSKENNQYRGQFATVDVETGNVTALAEAIGANDIFFDLTSDGKSVAFTATAAAKTGESLKADDAMTETVWVLDIENGTVWPSEKPAKFAIFSASGTKVLLGTAGQGSDLVLQVADRGFSKVVDVASDGVASVGSTPGNDTKVYPSWVGDDHIAYLASHAVYGTSGKNLKLVISSADGTSHRDVQKTIDDEVATQSK